MTPSTSRAVSVAFNLAAKTISTQGKRSFFAGKDKCRPNFFKLRHQLDNVMSVALIEGDAPLGSAADLLRILVTFEATAGRGNWKNELALMTDMITLNQQAA